MRKVKILDLVKWGNSALFASIALYIAAYNYEGVKRGLQVAGLSFLFLLYTSLLFIKIPAVRYLRWSIFVLLFAYSLYTVAYGYPDAPEPSRLSL